MSNFNRERKGRQLHINALKKRFQRKKASKNGLYFYRNLTRLLKIEVIAIAKQSNFPFRCMRRAELFGEE